MILLKFQGVIQQPYRSAFDESETRRSFVGMMGAVVL